MSDELMKKAEMETFTPQASTQIDRVLQGMKKDIETRMIQINYLLPNFTDDEIQDLGCNIKKIHEYYTEQCATLSSDIITINKNDIINDIKEEKSLWSKLVSTIKGHYYSKRKSRIS